MGWKDTLKEMKRQDLEEEAEAERKRQEDAGQEIVWDESVEWGDEEDIDPEDIEEGQFGLVVEDDDDMDPEDLDDGEYD